MTIEELENLYELSFIKPKFSSLECTNKIGEVINEYLSGDRSVAKLNGQMAQLVELDYVECYNIRYAIGDSENYHKLTISVKDWPKEHVCLLRKG